jgi:hypothetical protein
MIRAASYCFVRCESIGNPTRLKIPSKPGKSSRCSKRKIAGNPEL